MKSFFVKMLGYIGLAGRKAVEGAIADVAGGISAETARGLLEAYKQKKREQMVLAVRELVSEKAAEGHNRLVIRISELDDMGAAVLRKLGFHVVVEEGHGSWEVSWTK